MSLADYLRTPARVSNGPMPRTGIVSVDRFARREHEVTTTDVTANTRDAWTTYLQMLHNTIHRVLTHVLTRVPEVDEPFDELMLEYGSTFVIPDPTGTIDIDRPIHTMTLSDIENLVDRTSDFVSERFAQRMQYGLYTTMVKQTCSILGKRVTHLSLAGYAGDAVVLSKVSTLMPSIDAAFVNACLKKKIIGTRGTQQKKGFVQPTNQMKMEGVTSRQRLDGLYETFVELFDVVPDVDLAGLCDDLQMQLRVQWSDAVVRLGNASTIPRDIRNRGIVTSRRSGIVCDDYAYDLFNDEFAKSKTYHHPLHRYMTREVHIIDDKGATLFVNLCFSVETRGRIFFTSVPLLALKVYFNAQTAPFLRERRAGPLPILSYRGFAMKFVDNGHPIAGLFLACLPRDEVREVLANASLTASQRARMNEVAQWWIMSDTVSRQLDGIVSISFIHPMYIESFD